MAGHCICAGCSQSVPTKENYGVRYAELREAVPRPWWCCIMQVVQADASFLGIPSRGQSRISLIMWLHWILERQWA